MIMIMKLKPNHMGFKKLMIHNLWKSLEVNQLNMYNRNVYDKKTILSSKKAHQVGMHI